jgi:CrcB protein
MTILSIALGGAIGSVLRHLGVSAIGAPWGVAAVNVAGSFAIGVLYVLLASRSALAPALMTGLLGGFTTFSAFSLDTLKLWEAGQPAQAALYVATSVLLSLAAVVAGVSLARAFA